MFTAQRYKDDLLIHSPKAKTLKIVSQNDFKSCNSYCTGFNDVYGSIFSHIFNKISLKHDALNKIKELVVMRIAYPASKRKTAEISQEYGLDFNLESIYKLMDKLTENEIAHVKKIVHDAYNRIVESAKRTC